MATHSDIKDNQTAAVYVPWKTFQSGIEVLIQGLPPKLDRSVWSTFSGGVQSHILSAFRFVGFVDSNGYVQQALRDMVSAFINTDEAKKKELFRNLLETQYSKVAALATQNASNQAFRDTMRDEYNVTGTTLDRAVRFYLDAAEYAGVAASPHWSKKGAKRNKRPRDSDGGVGVVPDGRDKQPTPPERHTFTLHQSVTALLTDLEQIATRWDEQAKKAWLSTFHVVLDYAYPAQTQTTNGQAEATHTNTERP